MAPSARALPRKGELSSGRVLDIAADFFRTHGYAITTMRDIADAAGMKAGSLYYHFSSKDEILDQVLERGIGEAIKGFEAAMAALPPEAGFFDRFKAAVIAHLQTVYDYGTYTVTSRQLLKHIPESLREKHIAMRVQYDELWRNLIHLGVEAGLLAMDADEGLARLFMLGSLNWTSEWLDPKKKSFDELGHTFTDLFLNGVATMPMKSNLGPVKTVKPTRKSAKSK